MTDLSLTYFALSSVWGFLTLCGVGPLLDFFKTRKISGIIASAILLIVGQTFFHRVIIEDCVKAISDSVVNFPPKELVFEINKLEHRYPNYSIFVKSK